ncbi:hypothetical protein QUF75_03270, partial [Desulfococcaceae bacterium HSG7]|nr:hypothetical protein [Desulfococcaceae bacterium HSG7]
PSFLLAVGVGAAVHILSLVFQELRVGTSREDAVVHAFEHSGLRYLSQLNQIVGCVPLTHPFGTIHLCLIFLSYWYNAFLMDGLEYRIYNN